MLALLTPLESRAGSNRLENAHTSQPVQSNDMKVVCWRQVLKQEQHWREEKPSSDSLCRPEARDVADNLEAWSSIMFRLIRRWEFFLLVQVSFAKEIRSFDSNRGVA